MKKFSWILALIAALAMVFIGCGGGGEPGGGEVEDFVHNLSVPRTLELVDNFEYGHGYQGLAQWKEIFDGEKISKDENYQLKITFKVDRDLEDPLYVGLVDPSAAANYWRPLSWAGDPVKPAMIVGENTAENNIIKAGEEVSVLIDFATIADATSASASCNSIVFMTNGASKTACEKSHWDLPVGGSNSGHGAGTGEKGKVTITFTEFTFARGEIGDEVEPPPPPPPGPSDAVDQEVEMKAVGGSVAILSETSYQFSKTVAYSGSYTWFTVDFGDNKLSDFTEVTLRYEGVSGDSDWKRIGLIPKVADFSGSIGTGAEVKAAVINTIDPANDGSAPESNIGPQARTSGTDIVLEIDATKAAAFDTESVVNFSVYFGAGADTIVDILDIVFVSYKKDIPSIAIVFDYDPNVYVAVDNISGVAASAAAGSTFKLSGNIAPGNASSTAPIVWSIKTVGTTGATIDGSDVTTTAAGDLVVTATIANGIAIGTPFTKDFTISIFAMPKFSNATFIQVAANGKDIGFAGVDGDNDFDKFKSAEFVVFAFLGSNGGSRDGFGGMQIAVQFPPSFAWAQVETPGWTGFPNTADEIVYFVFPTDKLPNYTAACAATGAKIVLNTGFGASYVGAWLTDETLVKGDGVSHGTDGWITRDTGLTEE